MTGKQPALGKWTRERAGSGPADTLTGQGHRWEVHRDGTRWFVREDGRTCAPLYPTMAGAKAYAMARCEAYHNVANRGG